ncbi:MAG: hypothetical protein OEY34_08040 [Cyclobacteriaceae bacterium]|nr:hypothetical protein [Cyclobacteriaceae bacterium]
MMSGIKVFISAIILILITTEAFSCSCSRAWRNSFLSNIGRFDVVAMGTIIRINSGKEMDEPYLKIKKLYKGQVKDSLIHLMDGGLDCRHFWMNDSGFQVVVGLIEDKNDDAQSSKYYYGLGCITSVLVLSESDRFITESKNIYYAGQVRKPGVSWLFRKMKVRKFERRLYLKTLFHKSEIKKENG